MCDGSFFFLIFYFLCIRFDWESRIFFYSVYFNLFIFALSLCEKNTANIFFFFLKVRFKYISMPYPILSYTYDCIVHTNQYISEKYFFLAMISPSVKCIFFRCALPFSENRRKTTHKLFQLNSCVCYFFHFKIFKIFSTTIYDGFRDDGNGCTVLRFLSIPMYYYCMARIYC